MLLLRHFLSSIFLFVLASSATAGEGEQLLERFLTQSKTMSADFVQTLRTDDNEVLQESKGHFYLNRPGKFRWNYTEPYAQEIVSDGEQVWVYDVDLKQVTVQNKSASTNNTPMALMEGKLQLKEAYNVSELDHRDGIYRLKLSSKSKDVDFSELIVGVDEQGLKFMQLRDQFEQTTDIVFVELELNKKLASDLFEFTPPEGVDVYGGS
ncbi:MAG: outer membrane lipoprotein chaperone LolA [Gammaproteobacteria bacterium]|nr:outer membrane lipoprotein chaperone LolA [Gammaproteobacteria bacterium]